MIQAALNYLREGFSIIPCKPDKKPYIRWEPFQKRHPTEDEVRKWWSRWPNAMVGIVTGAVSGIFVVDVDDPVEGMAGLSPYLTSARIPTVKTPRGGFHFYFRNPERLVSNATRFLPGIDARGEGGYVIAPPSVNGTGKGYEWLQGFGIGEVEPPEAPETLLSLLNNACVFKEGVRKDVRPMPPDLTDPYNSLHFLTLGTRDNDLFHVANCMIKGGLEEEKAQKVLEIIAENCDPPFPKNEVTEKIKSALKRSERKERNLTEDLRKWIFLTSAYFSLTEAYEPLQILTCQKNTVHQIAHRFVKEGFIERHPSRNGVYRLVEKECEDIDFLHAPDQTLDIKWQFEIERYFRTLPKNIIVIAGEPDSGKTALLLNLVRLNMDRHKVFYYSSEMGANEFKSRLSKFDLPLSKWTFTPKERSSNFADVIVPDAINVIDFLEIHDEFYKIGGMIKEIFDKLEEGIAVIAIQKNRGQDFGLGGMRGLEKARLYLTLEPGLLKIKKAKNWATEQNPNGLQIAFKLLHGCKFMAEGEWQREERVLPH